MSDQTQPGTPGDIRFGDGHLVLNVGRETSELIVVNTGDRAVQVGSHFHFFEANPALRFTRRAAFGRRLNIPSGTAVRFEAGQTHTVSLVPFGGRRHVAGFRAATNGKDIETALGKLREQGVDVEGDAE